VSMINIARNYRSFSSEELRDKAYMGNLEVNGYDLTDFLEYIFQDMHSEQDLKEAFEEGKKEAQDSEISICSECEEDIYG
jgi:hypothetical protein